MKISRTSSTLGIVNRGKGHEIMISLIVVYKRTRNSGLTVQGTRLPGLSGVNSKFF